LLAVFVREWYAVYCRAVNCSEMSYSVRLWCHRIGQDKEQDVTEVSRGHEHREVTRGGSCKSSSAGAPPFDGAHLCTLPSN
jgi:hypothetical protein